MEETLISFETAELAKKKGFDWNCRFLYKSNLGWEEGIGIDYNWNRFNSYSAPSQSLLQKWLREVHGINIVVSPSYKCFNILFISKYNKIDDQNEDLVLNGLEFKDFETYEEALEVGLSESLKLIK